MAARLAALVGAVALPAAVPSSSYYAVQDSMMQVKTSIVAVMESPWPAVRMIAASIETGMSTSESSLAHVTYVSLAGMRDSTTFYMIYVGFEDDGTFLGYYNDGFGPTGNVSYTYLDGGACAWNYTKACGENFPCDAAADTWLATTPACREFYVIDEISATPACANVTHGACGGFIDMRGCENASLKSATYDPRMRPWYVSAKASDADVVWSDIYSFATGEEMGITATQKVYLGGEFYGVVAADFVLTQADEELAMMWPPDEGGMVYLASTDGLLVAASNYDWDRVAGTTAAGANDTLIRAAHARLVGSGPDDALVTVDGALYWFSSEAIDDGFEGKISELSKTIQTKFKRRTTAIFAQASSTRLGNSAKGDLERDLDADETDPSDTSPPPSSARGSSPASGAAPSRGGAPAPTDGSSSSQTQTQPQPQPKAPGSSRATRATSLASSSDAKPSSSP